MEVIWCYWFMQQTEVAHSQPLDVVLGLLGDELNSLQDVGYVVDASLLDIQDLRGPVEIHHAVGRLGKQVEKALGGQVQGGVVAGLFRRSSGNWKERGFKKKKKISIFFALIFI